MRDGYIPYSATWELTMGCNMRCKHCGSACKEKLEGELTTEEALDLCKEIRDIGVKYITLTGGEPTTRLDWDIIASKLNSYAIQVNMVSNAWLIDEETALRAKKAGIYNFAISLDGLKSTHDYMRRPGSFERVMSAIDILKDNEINVSIITTINKQNIKELSELKDILIKKRIDAWQLQYAMPMGEFHKRKREMMISTEQINEIIDFAYENRGEIRIFLGDCIGYYTKKEMCVKENMFEYGHCWNGCPAGKYAFGIMHNGDIVGCVSIREMKYREGNVRLKTLGDIWKNRFNEFRNLKQIDLKGFCRYCRYGFICLGGCSNARITLHTSLKSENEYCAYSCEIKKDKKQFEDLRIDRREELDRIIKSEKYDLAVYLIEEYLDSESISDEILNALHYSYFKLGMFDKSLEIAEKVLKNNPNDKYAIHGKCVSLGALKREDEARKFLATKQLKDFEKNEIEKDFLRGN